MNGTALSVNFPAMRSRFSQPWAAILCAAVVLSASGAVATETGGAATAVLTAQQQAVLNAYKAARIAHERAVDSYWRDVDLKRKKRKAKQAAGKPVTALDFVKRHPPEYKGPKRPDEIFALLPKAPKAPPPAELRSVIPVVTDFLHQAKATYGFDPDIVSNDEFMISYAIESLKLGLSKEQVVRVYALETGGSGSFDLQSGYNAKTGRAASTALGYAQLLSANSIEQVQTKGESFAARLERQAEQETGVFGRAGHLREKAAIVRRMIADARAIPNKWSSQLAYAKTAKGMAIHALNLDADIGPWMQVTKLKSVKDFAAKKGMLTLTGGQMEMMNLSGPQRGFEMMQPLGRDVPTSNFFDRGGYERNPVVHNKTGAELLLKLDEIMDRNLQKPNAVKFSQIFDRIGRRMPASASSTSAIDTIAGALDIFK